jgi:ankyrin repeat protein
MYFLAAIGGQINAHSRVAVTKQLFDAGLELDQTSQGLNNAMFSMLSIAYNENLVKIVLTKVDWYLEAKNSDGLTPLIYALHHRKEYFKIFLDAGADSMARSTARGRPTALMLSVQWADLGTFRQLLNRSDCEVNARDDYGQTALLWCARMARYAQTAVTMIAELLDRSDIAPNLKDNSGRTALMVAMDYASEGAVNALLRARNIRPDSGVSNRSTPLRLSIIRYVETQDDVFLRITRALLHCGADFYNANVLPTPADTIARYDESICADLRQIWDALRIRNRLSVSTFID